MVTRGGGIWWIMSLRQDAFFMQRLFYFGFPVEWKPMDDIWSNDDECSQ